MAAWKSRSVKDVVQDIDDEVYVLPVIQRWLVWNEAKMELLFDSLLKGNSFGGIMILEEAKGDRPLFASRRFSRFGEEHQASVLDENERTTFLVIDGQQRLQTFYMSLKGGINSKKLYFNLFSSPHDYEFRFEVEQSELPRSETGDSGEPAEKLWYRVDTLFERLRATGNAFNVAGQIVRHEKIEDQNLVGAVQQNVLKFYMSIFADPAIGLSTVTVNHDPEFLDDERLRVVELFRRLNDGGTRLSTLDLVASMFKGFDYRMEQFFRDVRQFNDIGVTQDEVIKLLFLLQDNHAKEVTQITAKDTAFAIKNRDRIVKSLEATRKFLQYARLYDFYHTGGRSDIPLYFIAYHIFHKPVATDALTTVYDNHDANNPDFLRAKRWIYLSLLNGVFSRGCGWIPYLTGIRKILNVIKNYKGKLFPAEELFQVYKNHPLRFSDEVTPDKIDTWDRDFVFYLLYDYQVAGGRDIDHIHPRSLLEAHLSTAKEPDFKPHQIHSLANFQLLDPGTNRNEKRMQTLAAWIAGGIAHRRNYLDRHLIPRLETLWEIKGFADFLSERAQLIATKVEQNMSTVVNHDPPILNDETSSTVHSRLEVIKHVIERRPIPNGQIQLYQTLYQNREGLEITHLAKAMGRTKSNLYGVLGALGNRINNTPGVHEKQGVAYVLEFATFDSGDGWGWKMRPELRQVLETGKYKWAADWIK